MATISVPKTDERIAINAPVNSSWEEILTPEALGLVRDLAANFDGRRQELLEARHRRQAEIDGGALPDFLPETKTIRESSWKVAPIPHHLMDRRVEITGPVDRKMIINALNSGAQVFMADFEDSNSPTWSNVMEGQVNLRDAVRRTITFASAEGKQYALAEKTDRKSTRLNSSH